jgi:NADH-quinone oxidoreductase subunit J
MIESALLWFFAAGALGGAVAMLLARHPMRVAIGLIVTMLSLGGVYAMLGLHAIAVFQVLIYVGAVMVFMVYVIMLLDVRDPSFTSRYSRLLLPGLAVATLLFVLLVWGLRYGAGPPAPAVANPPFGVAAFSVAFLAEYWLQFELVSVLLVAAVVAALAVIKGRRGSHG